METITTKLDKLNKEILKKIPKKVCEKINLFFSKMR